MQGGLINLNLESIQTKIKSHIKYVQDAIALLDPFTPGYEVTLTYVNKYLDVLYSLLLKIIENQSTQEELGAVVETK